MKTITLETIKTVISNIIVFGAIIILGVILLYSIMRSDNGVIGFENGNIKNAIETNQY
jgi:hypothetical protein